LAKDGDHPYVRLAWRFPAIAFDLASQELLINHCPSCGKQLSWYQIQSVYRCQSCQFDLRNCTPVVAPQEFVEATRQLAGSIGLLPGKPLKLAYPFQTNDLPTTMLVLEWCAHFDGLMRLDHTSQTVVNASRGLRVAETWPASLELAVDLLFRQDRSEKFEFSVLQPALKSLPTSEMRIEAMQQLAQIMLRPEFRERERPPDYSRPRWKYFDAT